MTNVAISSGHGLHVRGASGSPVPPELDEVNEARRVVDRVYELLNGKVKIAKFHDNTSTSQNQNLDTIVAWHNKQGSNRDRDVSVHFNATEGAYGTEVWYKTQGDLAAKVSAAMAKAGGFKDRGKKHTDNLAFLNGTSKPAVLLEVCFCDSTSDSNLYNKNFEAICKAIAESIADVSIGAEVPPLPEHPPPLDPGHRPEEQPVRVTVEHPPGVSVNLTKSYNTTGVVEVTITHPRSQQVDTDVKEAAGA